jgi:Kef-type K+ transport system membrane component KefB
MDNIWFIAAIWMGLALVASLISIRLGLSVALIEIVVGVAAGNVHFGDGRQILRSTDWTNFLAMLAAGLRRRRHLLHALVHAQVDGVHRRPHGDDARQ